MERLGERPKPFDEWQKRYGWPSAEKGINDEAVLSWMKKVTNLIWEARYRNDEKAAHKGDATEKRKFEKVSRLQDDRRKRDEAAAAAIMLEESLTEEEEEEQDEEDSEEQDEED